MMAGRGLTRRRFITHSGAGAASLLLGMNLGLRHSPAAAEAKEGMPLNAFLRIDPDSTITVLMNVSEFGNGAYTVVNMMVAEELDATGRVLK